MIGFVAGIFVSVILVHCRMASIHDEVETIARELQRIRQQLEGGDS